MTIAIDLDTHLASNLTALAQQGVANTNNFAHYANLAFTKGEEAAMKAGDAQSQRYRIWIAGYDDWQPTDWHDVPPRAIALEPADGLALSAAQAQSFLEGFNGEMLHRQLLDGQMPDGRMPDGQMLNGAKRLWAIAVPVMVRYDGDPHPGETVAGHRF